MNGEEDPFFQFRLLLEKASVENRIELAKTNFQIRLIQIIIGVAYALLWLFVGFSLALIVLKY